MPPFRILVASVILLVSFANVCAEGGYDIHPDHWAHDAVEYLASRGLVLGYPDGSFLGNRALTRYEMAALVKRVLDQIDQQLQHPAERPSQPATAVSPEDLDRVRRLVEEFKVELTVIGTRMDEVSRNLAALQQQVQEWRAELDEAKAAAESALEEAKAAKAQANEIQATVADKAESEQVLHQDVEKLKKLKLSGYIQARFRSAEGET
ncbi:MAG: S-layer homology domain-containing protein, partial [Armatimonadota bacterium]